MTLPLTPEILAAAYEFLRATPPFNRWRLPPAESIKFRVTMHPDAYAQHDVEPHGDRIDVSIKRVGHSSTLLQTMAHEMVHVGQRVRKEPRTHGAEFARRWARVAKYHGFDPKEF